MKRKGIASFVQTGLLDSSSWDIESRGCAHERRIDRVAIDGPPVLPPSIDEVYEEGIPVCAPLEMPDRYRFHSLRRPRLKLSDANDPRAGGQSKRLSRNLFRSNAPGLPILTDANPSTRRPRQTAALGTSGVEASRRPSRTVG